MKTRTITIAKKDIFFDVDAATHVFARATEGSNLHRADALESDTGDAMAESLLTRYSDRRAAELSERLSHFLTTPVSPVTEAAAALGTATGYTFTLYVEDAFQDELMTPLASAMEKYVAHGVIADWFRDAGDAQAAAYAQMLPGDLAEAQEHLVKRKLPRRT